MPGFGLIFTNPALWAGLAALAVPLAIHLLTRRNSRTLIFPTIRFIRKVQASQSALFRLRHLLLLLVRTVFVALLLMAFLKPVLERDTLSGGEGKEAKHAVIVVLDASASMGCTSGGITPFNRAKLLGDQTLNELRDGDVANLIVAGAAPIASFLQPTGNRFHLRNDLQLARLTQERADFDAAIAEAIKELSQTPGYRKEIHLISDFQRSNWAPVDFSKIPREIKVVLLSVTPESPANLAVTEVLMQPPAPARGEEVEVTCKVANHGGRSQTVPLRLKFGDEPPLQRELDVPAGASASAGFRLRANRTGLFEGELSLPDDSLVVDNRRYFTLSVSDRVRIVVLSDEERNDPFASHRFLLRAINPGSDAATGAFAPTLLGSAQFDKFAASGVQLVIISGVKEFASPTTAALTDYLKEGGSVIYLLAGMAERSNLGRLEREAGDLKLPFQLGNLIDHNAGPGDRHGSLTEANFDHPILKPFREARDLGAIRFLRYYATEREPGQGQILLRYDDQSIALAKKSVGAGALLLGNFSFSPRHGDLPKRTIFVPFVHELVKGMRPQSATGRPFMVGAPASTTVSLPENEKELRFTGPSGARLEAAFERSGADTAVIFPETRESGFYRVYAGDRPAGSVAVNVDPRESNLEALGMAQMRALSELTRDQVFSVSDTKSGSLRNLREGKPIWHYCLLAALLVLGAEQALTLVWRR